MNDFKLSRLIKSHTHLSNEMGMWINVEKSRFQQPRPRSSTQCHKTIKAVMDKLRLCRLESLQAEHFERILTCLNGKSFSCDSWCRLPLIDEIYRKNFIKIFNRKSIFIFIHTHKWKALEMLSSSEQFAPYVAVAEGTFQFPIIYRLISHRMYHELFYKL